MTNPMREALERIRLIAETDGIPQLVEICDAALSAEWRPDPKTVERLASDLAAHDGMNFAAMEDDQRAAYNSKPYWRRLAEAAIRSLSNHSFRREGVIGMSWDELCGNRRLRAIRTDVTHPFDPNANGVALDLNDICVFVFEDPSDGYRSAAVAPMIVKANLFEFGANPEYMDVPVLIRRWEKTEGEYGSNPDGVEFIDARNGKTILLLGTDNSDDYYPSYTCDWRPQNLADNEDA